MNKQNEKKKIFLRSVLLSFECLMLNATFFFLIVCKMYELHQELVSASKISCDGFLVRKQRVHLNISLVTFDRKLFKVHHSFFIWLHAVVVDFLFQWMSSLESIWSALTIHCHQSTKSRKKKNVVCQCQSSFTFF